MNVLAYADPDLEALRVAITDNEVLQAIGRGRAVNRTAGTPLTVFICADVVVPMPAKRIVRWGDVRPTVQQRMAARGLVTDSPTDAAALYPDLFPTPAAARQAFHRGISVTFPYESLFIGECHSNSLEGRYRPEGRGQQYRRMWIAGWRFARVREALDAAVGALAVFEIFGGSGDGIDPGILFPPMMLLPPITDLLTIKCGDIQVEVRGVVDFPPMDVLVRPVPARGYDVVGHDRS
jgi:putative DNA primase/helicase